MSKKLNLTPFTSYFHDGEVLEIIHKNDNIVMFLRSAEINTGIIKDNILSKDNRLECKLHIEGIKLLLNNGMEFNKKIQMVLPDNDLLHLNIRENTVFCEIGWRGKNSGEVDFSDFEIHATKIWWESLS